MSLTGRYTSDEFDPGTAYQYGVTTCQAYSPADPNRKDYDFMALLGTFDVLKGMR